MAGSSSPDSSSGGSSPFLNRVRAACRRKGYTYWTEKTYHRWIVRYVKQHGTQHPRAFGKEEVRDYLSHLAMDRNVAAATQNQALNALLFLQLGRARRRVGRGIRLRAGSRAGAAPGRSDSGGSEGAPGRDGRARRPRCSSALRGQALALGGTSIASQGPGF
jgi:hypothetical protein